MFLRSNRYDEEDKEGEQEGEKEEGNDREWDIVVGGLVLC